MKKLKIILSILFVSAIFFNGSCQQIDQSKATVQKIKADDFKKQLDQKIGLTIDVRTPDEFSEGHIPGAKNIDYQAENFKTEIQKLDKSKQYNVYCKSGKRSTAAADLMRDAGFLKVFNLEGGILGWKEKGYAVEK